MEANADAAACLHAKQPHTLCLARGLNRMRSFIDVLIEKIQ